MPNRFKVYFDEEGQRCPKNIQALRRLPECGVFDRNELKFIPANRPNPPVPPKPVPPKPGPFQPRRMNLPPAFNGSNIPDIPEEPNPVFPTKPGMLIGGATGPGDQSSAARLPQDETTLLQGKGVRELSSSRYQDYQRISTTPVHVQSAPVNIELAPLLSTTNPRNTTNDDVFQSLDDAFRSIPHVTTFTNVTKPGLYAQRASDDLRPRIRPFRPPIADPRDTEFSLPGEEQIPAKRPPPRKFKLPKKSPPLSAKARGKLPMYERVSRKFVGRPGYSLLPTEEQELQELTQRNPQAREMGLRNVEEDIGIVPSGAAGPSSAAGPPDEDRSSPGFLRAGRKRRGEYFELDQRDPDAPRMVAKTGRGRVMSQLEQRGSRMKANIQFAANNAKRFRAGIVDTLRTGAEDRMQDIRAFTTRQFGQGYERIVSDDAPSLQGMDGIEMMGNIVNTSDTGDITVTQPITEEVTGLEDVPLDFSPFQEVEDEPTVIGRAAPKLSFSERINIARDSFSGISASEAGEMAGKTGAGLLFGMGVSALLGPNVKTGNQYINSILVGGTAGFAGDVGSRVTALLAQRAMIKIGNTAVSVGSQAALDSGVDAAAFASARLGTSILRGGAEGLGVGIAAAPLDLMLNNTFLNMGASHTAANIGSSSITGLGSTAVIGAISLAAAPETLGLSLAVGLFATGASVIASGLIGQAQDRAEAAARAKAIDGINRTAVARKDLLSTLPAYNYNFNDALAAFKGDKVGLGIDSDTWSAFSRLANQLFTTRPSNNPAPSPGGTDTKPTDPDQQRLNNLYSKYIQHELISEVCSGVTTGCDELKSKDQGPLTDEEVAFLNDKTNNTWVTQANMQVMMSKQELGYTSQRIQQAQIALRDAWNQNQELPSQMDSYTRETAYLDPTFQSKFETAIKLDAQQRVIDAYYNNQTRFEALPPNIQTAAGYDKNFKGVIDAFYASMDNTASQLEVTIPQLIELQSLTGEQQRSIYQAMQFDRIKTQSSVVADAQSLSVEQDQVRAAGFYDIDQAFMQTDPTAISSWHPTDSQILQAHAAGLNLNQYVAYMHQLALGQAGDYSRLPTYTEAQLRSSGLLDYSHLQDELQMAGYRRDLYIYDPDTRTFTLNPNVPNLPDQDQISSFIPEYTPDYLERVNNDYVNMIHGLNEQNQASVDQYNTNLRRLLTTYGDQYNNMVAAQNEYLASHSGPVTQLLHFNVAQMFNQYSINYNPLENALPTSTGPIGGDVTAPDLKDGDGDDEGDDEDEGEEEDESNQEDPDQGIINLKLQEEMAAAAALGLTLDQYLREKEDVTEEGVRFDPSAIQYIDTRIKQEGLGPVITAPGVPPATKLPGTRSKGTTTPSTTTPSTTRPSTTRPSTTRPSTTRPSTTRPGTTTPGTTTPATTRPAPDTPSKGNKP